MSTGRAGKTHARPEPAPFVFRCGERLGIARATSALWRLVCTDGEKDFAAKVSEQLDAMSTEAFFETVTMAQCDALHARIEELQESLRAANARVARLERDIAPKRKVGGLG